MAHRGANDIEMALRGTRGFQVVGRGARQFGAPGLGNGAGAVRRKAPTVATFCDRCLSWGDLFVEEYPILP